MSSNGLDKTCTNTSRRNLTYKTCFYDFLKLQHGKTTYVKDGNNVEKNGINLTVSLLLV